MGKQGPCYHCGVTSTPLWRNGPPDKPILCNACGSRWRTKGTLVNYTPLHARAEPDDFDYHRVQKVKSISLKNKDSKLLKRKLNHENAMVGGFAPDYNTGFRKVLEEDTSNRSSSGSAISNSDSCMQFGSAEASDLTGPAQSNVWDSKVPSWKRTCVNRPKQSPVEKLAKDLHTILHEQQSYLSGSSEEDLLFESDTPMVSVEIGHGSVLIRHPSSMAREEESEASSLSVDNKRHSMNEAYSRVTTLPVHNNYQDVNFSSRGTDKSKKPIGQEMEPDQIRRDKPQGEKQQIIGNRNSPLCYIDLKDVLNFEEFASQLTSEEQQHLLKYLPFVDTARLPENLKSMFDSPQFSENLSSFQKLLAEGVFDLSVPVEKSEGYKMLKKFTLFNLTKSKWVEQYNVLQDGNCEYSSGGGSVVAEARSAIPSGHSVNAKRSRDCKFQNIPGEKSTMRSPKRVFTKANYGNNESMENDGSCFSPRSLFALPPDHSSLMLNAFQYVEESSDQDLLLDVPSHSSFPQAELLLPTTFASQASTSSSSVYQNSFRP